MFPSHYRFEKNPTILIFYKKKKIIRKIVQNICLVSEFGRDTNNTNICRLYLLELNPFERHQDYQILSRICILNSSNSLGRRGCTGFFCDSSQNCFFFLGRWEWHVLISQINFTGVEYTKMYRLYTMYNDNDS